MSVKARAEVCRAPRDSEGPAKLNTKKLNHVVKICRHFGDDCHGYMTK